MGHSCVILAGQFFTEGYFLQRVLRQFRHIQNYTSSGEAIDRRSIYPLRRHSSALLINACLSWKGNKSSSSDGLAKQDNLTSTSNYDSWWERAYPLPLCPRSLTLRGELHGEPSAPAQDSMLSREDNASSSNKRIKSNKDVSDISLVELKSKWLDGWPSWQNSRRRMLIRSQRLNSQIFSFSLFFFLA
ncbi:hypothetical protein AMTRI_Chr04g246870 [Amborella trichopoda]